MIKHNKITISFLPNEEDLWKFIQTKKETCNISEYVRSLIRKDMNVGSATNNEELVLQKILRRLEERENGQNQSEKSFDDMLIIDEIKDTINNLF